MSRWITGDGCFWWRWLSARATSREIKDISIYERALCSNRVCKLVSMSSVTNNGSPSSFVAPMNCSKQGWRHLEVIFISRSNNLQWWGERINSWICFTSTEQPQNLPSTTLPQPPLPRNLLVSWMWSLEMNHSGDCCRWCSHNSSWAADRVVSNS